jgi:hypothetical protein
MTRIVLREVMGRDILAGKSDGIRDYPKLADAIEDTPAAEIVVLDWSGIEIASASYFGSTFIPLLRMAIAGQLDRYFVMTGLNNTCLDELRLVLEAQSLVALVGEWKQGAIKNAQVVGKLDAAYAETLVAVQHVQSASATQLFEQHQRGPKIGKTGWINRLANLHRLRLVRKQRVGRQYIFESLA